MNITICGSIAFYEQMQAVKKQLEELGHTVLLPPTHVKDKDGNMITVAKYYEIRKASDANEEWIWVRKKEAILTHYKKIDESEAILVTNYDKNDVKGYIGTNTLMEMGVALYTNKKIFLLNNIPTCQATEEVKGMQPIVLRGDLHQII